ncbi:MAG TPA: type II toxin-antitoxin system VapC family toxin [Acetobacteraceae bacterium]|nr:type II toxin-antitoxin system VapC family toxin [Acetobacteraceae bacterium]
MNALFDTNILIDYLRGIHAARAELRRYDHIAISVISWIEVMVGAPDETEQATRDFLAGFPLVALDDGVAALAATLRRAHRVKLPDAIIWASARARGMLLVTRDGKGFPADDPGVRIPYAV